MDIEQEKAAIQNAKFVVLVVQGVRTHIRKGMARTLVFERQGWTLDIVGDTVVLTHDAISPIGFDANKVW